MKVKGLRGRPTKDEYDARLQALRVYLADTFPGRLSVSTMAEASGLNWLTVRKLQTDVSFLLSLPQNIRGWFRDGKHKRTGLDPIWRAVLDLHFYTALAQGGTRNLYTNHAAVWGSATHLTQRNWQELARVTGHDFVSLMTQVGWLDNAKWRNDEPTFLRCSEGCSVAAAVVGSEYPPASVLGAREIIEQGCDLELPWLPVVTHLLTPGKKPIHYVKQILGLV